MLSDYRTQLQPDFVKYASRVVNTVNAKFGSLPKLAENIAVSGVTLKDEQVSGHIDNTQYWDEISELDSQVIDFDRTYLKENYIEFLNDLLFGELTLKLLHGFDVEIPEDIDSQETLSLGKIERPAYTGHLFIQKDDCKHIFNEADLSAIIRDVQTVDLFIFILDHWNKNKNNLTSEVEVDNLMFGKYLGYSEDYLYQEQPRVKFSKQLLFLSNLKFKVEYHNVNKIQFGHRNKVFKDRKGHNYEPITFKLFDTNAYRGGDQEKKLFRRVRIKPAKEVAEVVCDNLYGYLPRKVIELNPRSKAPLKRLAFYVHRHLKIRTANKTFLMPFTVDRLINVMYSKENQKSKGRPRSIDGLNSVLEELSTMLGYEFAFYPPEGKTNEATYLEMKKSGSWRDFRVFIEPPGSLLNIYSTVNKHPKKNIAKNPPNSTGLLVRKFMYGECKGIIQTAEHLGFLPSEINDVIFGVCKTEAVCQKINSLITNKYRGKFWFSAPLTISDV